MKFKDPITGEYKTLHLKTGDTLPVGTIVSFEGDEIPEGYEEVIGEEARVVISSTEPTTGEEVWIQNTKNLFNINGDYASVVGSPTISDNSIILPESDGNAGYTKFLKKIEISGPITISFDVSNSDGYARLLLIPLDINGNVITNLTIDGYTYLDVYKGYYKNHTNGNYELVLNFPENVKYFQLGFVHTFGTFANVQIEQGEIATEYEKYVNKKIYIKNDNGVYEEFYDETNREMYSTGEQKIGTWIDGKPLYRKVITMGALPNAAAKYTPHGIQNLGTVVSLKGMAQNKETNSRIVLPCPDTTPQYIVQLFVSSTNIVLNTAFDQSKFNESFAIIEYTKITD